MDCGYPGKPACFWLDGSGPRRSNTTWLLGRLARYPGLSAAGSVQWGPSPYLHQASKYRSLAAARTTPGLLFPILARQVQGSIWAASSDLKIRDVVATTSTLTKLYARPDSHKRHQICARPGPESGFDRSKQRWNLVRSSRYEKQEIYWLGSERATWLAVLTGRYCRI